MKRYFMIVAATGNIPPLYRDEEHPKGNFVHIDDHQTAIAARDAVIRELVDAGDAMIAMQSDGWDALTAKAIALIGGEKERKT